jgi:hypothetical protein
VRPPAGIVHTAFRQAGLRREEGEAREGRGTGGARPPGETGKPARGLGVRIAVIALADHAGWRVIEAWGLATEHDFSATDEPGHPVGLYVKRRVRSQKES